VFDLQLDQCALFSKVRAGVATELGVVMGRLHGEGKRHGVGTSDRRIGVGAIMFRAQNALDSVAFSHVLSIGFSAWDVHGCRGVWQPGALYLRNAAARSEGVRQFARRILSCAHSPAARAAPLQRDA